MDKREILEVLNHVYDPDYVNRSIVDMGLVTEDGYTDRYDVWYNSPKGKTLLATEVACLRPLVELFSEPYLEVGVGTGRFAEALGIEWGIDPSPRAIEKARRRRVNAVLGVG